MDSIKRTQKWLSDIVINLSLCPFAKKVFIENQILFVQCDFTELKLLSETVDDTIQTILNVDTQFTTALIIIHSGLDQFGVYLDVLNTLEQHLMSDGKNEYIQIASFHPQYQFAETELSDIENYTNRSPYPIIHLLRVDDVSAAINSHPDIDSIPVQNILKMKRLGLEGIKSLFS